MLSTILYIYFNFIMRNDCFELIRVLHYWSYIILHKYKFK